MMEAVAYWPQQVGIPQRCNDLNYLRLARSAEMWPGCLCLRGGVCP